MNKAEKKFRRYAILVIFVLLTVLLAVINGVNFTMAAGDADEITARLAERQGVIETGEGASEDKSAQQQTDRGFRMGPMGPGSPEMNASLRYFTVAFTDKGETAKIVAYRISAVSKDEAKEWAAELLKEGTGWTRGIYRYRVYKKADVTYVSVIDQGRELLPSFRILIISSVGEALVLLVGWFVLLGIGRKIYAPLEEADRAQKNFIMNANKEFRLPLTIISGNTELLEREHGPDERTRSNRRQIAKLSELVEKLGTMGVFENEKKDAATVTVSDILSDALDAAKEEFASLDISLERNVEPNVTLQADPEAIKKMTDELVDNAKKYSLTRAAFDLKKENGSVVLEAKNDTTLPDGDANRVFDRFTVLDNAKKDSAGLGLSYVKEIIKAHNGRAEASVTGGVFTLRITL